MTITRLLDRQDMSQRLYAVQRHAKITWQTPQITYFTDHSVSHSERIIRLLDSLCELLPSGLNEDEAYVLLCAAYLHDVGMQWKGCLDSAIVREKYPPEQISAARGDDSQRDKIVREEHHSLSEEWIKSDPSHASVEADFVDEVILVIRGHRKESIAKYTDTTKAGKDMRIRLLTALLRVADEMDLDYNRVNIEILEHYPISEESKAHWWKCHYVESVDVEDGRVRLRFKFSVKDASEVSRIVSDLVLGELTRKVDKEGLVDVLWRDVKLRIDDKPQIDQPSVTKVPVPVNVLALYRKQWIEKLIGDTTIAAMPAVGLGAGVIHIAVGDTPENMVMRAAKMDTEGATEPAVRLLLRGVDLYPQHPQLNAMLAALSVKGQQWDVAEQSAQRAANADPVNYVARMVLGQAAIRKKDYGRALAQLRIAEWRANVEGTNPPERALLHLTIGNALAGMADFHHAEQRMAEARAVYAAAGLAPAGTAASDMESLSQVVTTGIKHAVTWTGAVTEAEFVWEQVLGEWITDPPLQYTQLTSLPECILLAGEPGASNYTFECEFQIMNSAVGFFLRADMHATTGIMMQFTPTLLRRHQLLFGNYFSKPIREVALPVKLERLTWHRARFVAGDASISTYLDNELVDDWRDVSDDYAYGRVGFRLCPVEFALYRSPRVASIEAASPPGGTEIPSQKARRRTALSPAAAN
jgi:hypothetical protein